ncbi:hypothetical protein M514_06677 [Trichuris suis]|uniref:Uncharacterized protein n=1 Tax=Trichuris suis TaxID=68888 RepID=A0A085M5I4_9BILA|nr:hypothetical protein M513_06677 [Trichuris suis]KFD68986.1 hypothetical protein M514_06677 [Trichuris suis]
MPLATAHSMREWRNSMTNCFSGIPSILGQIIRTAEGRCEATLLGCRSKLPLYDYVGSKFNKYALAATQWNVRENLSLCLVIVCAAPSGRQHKNCSRIRPPGNFLLNTCSNFQLDHHVYIR